MNRSLANGSHSLWKGWSTVPQQCWAFQRQRGLRADGYPQGRELTPLGVTVVFGVRPLSETSLPRAPFPAELPEASVAPPLPRAQLGVLQWTQEGSQEGTVAGPPSRGLCLEIPEVGPVPKARGWARRAGGGRRILAGPRAGVGGTAGQEWAGGGGRFVPRGLCEGSAHRVRLSEEETEAETEVGGRGGGTRGTGDLGNVITTHCAAGARGPGGPAWGLGFMWGKGRVGDIGGEGPGAVASGSFLKIFYSGKEAYTQAAAPAGTGRDQWPGSQHCGRREGQGLPGMGLRGAGGGAEEGRAGQGVGKGLAEPNPPPMPALTLRVWLLARPPPSATRSPGPGFRSSRLATHRGPRPPGRLREGASQAEPHPLG